jgi:nucleoid-associated protein YgaU
MAAAWTHLAQRVARRQPLLVAAAVLFVLAAAAAVARWEGAFAPPPSAPAAIANRPTPPFAPTVPPALAAPAPPSFDVVRVDRSGHAVIAGRAPPGSEVTVASNGKTIGKVESDTEGEWVLVPDQPLPSGTGALTLSARLPNGTSLTGPNRVVVMVPDHSGEVPPVALLSGPSGTPRLIEAPPVAKGASPVGLDLLQYGQHETLRLAGRAPPNADVRVYVDDRTVGDARADAAGHWSLRVPGELLPGPHRIRLDQISPAGTVLARVAVPFDRPASPPGPEAAAGRVVVVRPGECLWVIAEHAYGNGVRYTLVFQANHDQIRNPSLIYPGQVFTLPPFPPTAGSRG